MTQTRWAVLGTANIAAKSFLPAMRDAGGRAVVVGSRAPGSARARAWADANQVERVADYDAAIHDDEVDAIYIALPNREHTTWTARATATGAAVVCEKPLGVDLPDTQALLDAIQPGTLLWEGFVFPFHPQTLVIRSELAELGRIREITSEFHFTARDPSRNIRWQADLGGGALRDVGCYCVRFARLILDAEPVSAVARAFIEHGVDAEIAAVLDFPGERRLIMSAGMRGAVSTFTRVIGDAGELRISNPFHPRTGDTVQRWTGGSCVAEWSAGEKPAFQFGIEHVQAVLRGAEPPRHLAATDSAGNARAFDMIAAAAR
ncbi:MAG TPA: Gfo/Idh/MocA family oxidoreductase [Jatrophihabitantaceae bacterium]|jgi:predicted dehydrogenase